MRLTQVTEPANPVLSLAEFFTHNRSPSLNPADELDIEAKILAATEYAETFTDRAFIERDYTLWLPGFPGPSVILPRAPVLAGGVTEIRYRVQIGVDPFVVLSPSTYYLLPSPVPKGGQACVIPIPLGSVWPYAEEVEIDFTAGYGDAADEVPASIKKAIAMLAGELYAQRKNAIVGTISTPAKFSAESLLGPYRTFSGWS